MAEQSEEGAMDSSSSSSLPSPVRLPEGLLDEPQAQDEEMEVDSNADEEESIDLAKMSQDYAHYLVVNSKQDTQALDERIESVVFRVEEFKQQLTHMSTNITGTTEKINQLHKNTEELKSLYTKIDQVEAFVNMVGRNVDQLEEAVTKAEREMDPGKLRKMFSVFRRSKPEASLNWQAPKVFKTRDYFNPQSLSPPPDRTPSDS